MVVFKSNEYLHHNTGQSPDLYESNATIDSKYRTAILKRLKKKTIKTEINTFVFLRKENRISAYLGNAAFFNIGGDEKMN